MDDTINKFQLPEGYEDICELIYMVLGQNYLTKFKTIVNRHHNIPQSVDEAKSWMKIYISDNELTDEQESILREMIDSIKGNSIPLYILTKLYDFTDEVIFKMCEVAFESLLCVYGIIAEDFYPEVMLRELILEYDKRCGI